MRFPDTAIEALAEAVKTRCCSFGDGDGSGGIGWADKEYRRVALELATAFCESMGLTWERTHFPHTGECERLTSRWRQVEGEDPNG